jgi:hypothetical protein
MTTDAPLWTDKTNTLFAALAFTVSLVSLYFSLTAKRLADRQEGRRNPRLVPSNGQAFVKIASDSGDRVYAFHISVSNPTDSDNAISAIDLSLTYISPTQTIMTVKLRAQKDDSINFLPSAGTHLSSPTRIAAHDTISGWCYFKVEGAMIAERAIDKYEIVLTDSHQVRSTIEPILVQEFAGAW